MTKIYNIIIKDGVDQTDLYSLVSRVTDELLHRSTFFIAECTDEQAAVIENHESVLHCLCEDDMPIEVDAVTKQIDYHRDYNHIQMRKSTQSNPQPKGNWGLIRHQSQTNNTTFNTDSYSTYTNTYTGEGVDIIMQIASVLDSADPEFMTNGVSRLQKFQWNTVSGMGDLPSVNYGIAGSTAVNSHAESVSYIAASNTYGWATGAKIYMWPRDQMSAAGKKLNTHGWDTFKLFHQQKGNSRPTLVIDAIEYNYIFPSPPSIISFRDNIYAQIAPSGVPTVSAERLQVLNKNGTQAYGNSVVPKFHGSYSPMPGFSSMNSKALTDQNKADIKTFIENKTNNTYYANYYQPVEEMIAAGVHHVSAAGNRNLKIALSDNIDYNNGVITLFSVPIGSGTSAEQNSRPYQFIPICREDLHQCGDTIVVAALGSQFSVDSGLNNKETLAAFSNRGDRVDTCAAGDNIYMDLYRNGEYEATGTSFASPNVGGMAACVLGKYPTTTTAQLRKYFREQAVGTETLYNSGAQPVPSSNVGDASYFEDPIGLKGYSGKIAYLDPNLVFNPSTISDTSITSTETVSASNKINFTISQINTKLGSI